MPPSRLWQSHVASGGGRQGEGKSVTEKGDQRRSAALGYLSLDEVRRAGRTATFAVFGDHLLYHNGAVHALPHAPDLEKPTELLSHPAVYRLTSSAGIEFGWLHLEGCDCPRCAAWRSAPAA
jgi:hypothetical protein